MAITITLEDFRAAFADLSEVPDSLINTYICLVNKIDACLDANYPDDDCVQTAIKLNAIAHFAQVSAGKYVKSQRAPSGASRSFDFMQSKEGMKLTGYGRIVESLDTAKCFESMFPQGDQVACFGLGRKCRS